MNRTKMYKENKSIIDGMSYKISKVSSIDAEEIQSYANEVFCQCLEKWDERRGEFRPFLTNSLYFKLYSFCRKRSRELSQLNENISKTIDMYYSHHDIIDTTLENLSRDSRMVVDFVMDIYPEYNENKKRLKKETVKRELKKRLNWKVKRIDIAFHELTACFQA